MKALCRVLTPLFLLTSIGAMAQINARMLRYPDVSATEIAFVYAGDVWLVPKQGGTAHRLSTPKGEEMFPRFSPDGTALAYSADYDGNLDIYVVPSSGGVPLRVTHNPARDRMVDWYPDGSSILYATPMASGRTRFDQLYRVDRHGGLPKRLPVPYGEFGAISPDGTKLAYMPLTRDFRTWKRYRGGMAPDIWLFDLASHAARNLTSSNANDAQPMWHGSKLYFLSDRGPAMRANIWALDTLGSKPRQVTHFKKFDVHFPAIGPSDIVFEAAGRIYRLELDTEKLVEVPITVVTDLATIKPRVVEVEKLIRHADVSPSGKRAVLEARGELFSLPAEHGPVLDLTNSSGVAERYPAWSPDGKSLAYFSDRSGEYQLTLRPADGSGAERTVTKLGPGFRYHPFWSPDGTKVAFADSSMAINLCDVRTGKVTVIDHGLYLYQGGLEGFTVSWSADSRWLAYARGLDNRYSAVFLYDTSNGSLVQVTPGFYDASEPVFDPEGKYLYLLTDRSFKPSYSDLDNTWIYANTTQIAAISLRKDVPSLLAPRNDVEGEDKDQAEKDKEQKKEATTPTGKEGTEKAAEKETTEAAGPKPVRIDLDGLAERMVVLPPEPGNYGRLAAVAGKIVYQREPRTGAATKESPIVLYDLTKREEKTVLNDADGFVLAAGGKKLLVWKKDAWSIIELAPEQSMKQRLATSRMEMTLDPRAEWKQIFTDAWRLERDYYYDPNMHGENWQGMRERYGKLLDNVVTRWDLNWVIGELIGEINSSHTYRGGGDLERGPKAGVGLLGADYSLENGAYRFSHIVRGASWDVEVRSPLAEPGVDVSDGDYLLAVNHVPIDTTKDPWAAFQGLADRPVLLTVNSQPTLEGAREVLVKTLKSETRLRNLEWIEAKRKRVDEATGGKVGYVYVPDTGRGGQTELVRQFRAQFDKEGLIIDERFNSGGQIPDRFIELLNRPLYCYWRVRNGVDWQWPPIAHVGPMAMLINGWSGSGGDAFPLFFREAHLGPLIGTRTWGGLIGISGVPQLIDGGVVTVPTFGIYSTSGKWIVEGHGVDPDIKVVDDPSEMAAGRDPQLERAISEVMKSLQENPPKRPPRPAYPDRAGQ
ncbi:MAG: PDZ domain-containing protein [Acidobacteria bacterium]|nr:PDZ domain-containing protein [Acidobacteriota bacterium]